MFRKTLVIGVGLVMGMGLMAETGYSAWWRFWEKGTRTQNTEDRAQIAEEKEEKMGIETSEKKGVYVLPVEGTETKGSLGAWSEELIEIDAKIKIEEKEIAKVMDRLKSKSTDSLIDMLSKDQKKTADIKEEEVKNKLSAIRILEMRLKNEEKEKGSEILGALYNLGSENKEIKKEVFFAIRKYQLEKKIKYATTDSLAKILFNKNSKIEERKKAINVLGLRREDKANIIPILTRALQDENKEIQMFAALGLYKLGENSIALPVLDRFLREGGEEIKNILFNNIDGLKINCEESPHMYIIYGFYNEEGARSLLKKALKSNDEEIRLRAILILGPLEKNSYQALIKFLTEAKNPELKYEALTRTSIKDEKMLECVEKLTKDKDKKVQEQANKALEKYYKNKGREK